MLERKPRIIFMGTSEFAVPILEALARASFLEIVAVFCQPDKPQGRGMREKYCLIKEKALRCKIPVLQPVNLKNQKDIQIIRNLKPDIIVIAAYGLLIPRKILKIPKQGCLNIHPSLLPKYRGPSPIQSVLLSGEKETGVSLIILDEKMDHGPIIAQRKIKITKEDSQITLSEKLANLGGEILRENLPLYLEEKIKPQPQDHQKASFTRLIKKEGGRINWEKSATQIERQIRAYLGWPGSFTFWKNRRLIILEAKALGADRYRGKNGEIFEINDELYAQCGSGILKIKKLKLSGKKATTGAEFLRGYPKIVGSSLN